MILPQIYKTDFRYIRFTYRFLQSAIRWCDFIARVDGVTKNRDLSFLYDFKRVNYHCFRNVIVLDVAVKPCTVRKTPFIIDKLRAL